MSTAELMQKIKRLSNAERLEVIEVASALVRAELTAENVHRHTDAARRMQAAALEAKELYEPGGELADWTAMDTEEVLDDSVGEHVHHAVKG